MHTFGIRTASLADIPLIRQLTYQVWPQTYAPILPKDQIDYMLELMYSESSLEKQMKEGSRFIIVTENERPVGFASYAQTSPGVWKLHKIYILPDQQGKGTGRFMIQHIIDIIRKENAKCLQLQVNRHNKARDFYEKLGFKVIQSADFDIGNGYFMNDYVMERKF